MPDYANGKIYKIIGNGLTYYGSTTQPLYNRKAQHNQLRYISKIIIEKGDWEMVLIENFNCENKAQLLSREKWWIENHECINYKIPLRTQKEWVIKNKEKLTIYQHQHYIANKEKSQQYYIDNKEIILAKRMERYYNIL